MFEEMRWLEYTQRLSRGRRGVFPSVARDDRSGDLPRQLLHCATVNGARDLGINTGVIEKGRWADFALLNLSAAALEGSDERSLLGAAIFGGCAEGLVANTCTAGRWTH